MKVGDRVAVENGHDINQLAVITGETKTSWRVGKNLYTKTSETYAPPRGAGAWCTNCLRKLTPEIEKDFYHRKRVAQVHIKIHGLKIAKLTDKTLIKLLEVLSECEKELGKDEQG